MAHSPSTPALPSHQYRAPCADGGLAQHFCADGVHHGDTATQTAAASLSEGWLMLLLSADPGSHF